MDPSVATDAISEVTALLRRLNDELARVDAERDECYRREEGEERERYFPTDDRDPRR